MAHSFAGPLDHPPMLSECGGWDNHNARQQSKPLFILYCFELRRMLIYDLLMRQA